MANPTTYPCARCGELTKRARGGGKAKVCKPCGMKAGPQAALEMAAKAGPAYEAWLASRGPLGGAAHSRG